MALSIVARLFRRVISISKTKERRPQKRTYSVGLFERSVLTSAEGFKQATNSTISEASAIVDEITNKFPIEPEEIVDLFDQLSNTLCRTADLAECVRLLHPSKDYVQQAQNCCVELSTYVEKLNTHKNLYDALKKVTSSSDFLILEEDTKRNASSLMHDFEISGIHLSKGERERAVSMNEHILSLNHAFMSNCNLPNLLTVDQVPPEFQNHFQTKDDFIAIDHVPYLSDEESVRELGYRIYNSASNPQKQLLDNLLLARHELASLVGYCSFAHRTLKDSMAGGPEVVLEFLNMLSEKIKPLAEEEAKKVLGIEGNNETQLLPWNLPWLTKLAQQNLLPDSVFGGLMEYFSLDSCIEGVNLLFSSLFGMMMKEQAISEGEVWHDSVRKFTFVADKETVGTLYGDLHFRPDKLQADCQFTIQGSRKLKDGSYQIPISVLNLCLPKEHTTPLSRLAVENLFHEMGHAAHSVLGRTRYQNISGTRCPTDFAEVPSNLMELFLKDKRVLKSFAKHRQTGCVIPDKYITAFQLSSDLFPALSAQMQILSSIMDQKVHGSHPLSKSTVEMFSDLHQTYSPIQYAQGTASFLRFTHLATYAGKYYSYLWSRAVANLIWRKCFRKDPYSKVMGGLYSHKMLAFGGGEDPNSLVRNLLGYQPSISELVESYFEEIIELKEKIHSIA